MLNICKKQNRQTNKQQKQVIFTLVPSQSYVSKGIPGMPENAGPEVDVGPLGYFQLVPEISTAVTLSHSRSSCHASRCVFFIL